MHDNTGTSASSVRGCALIGLALEGRATGLGGAGRTRAGCIVDVARTDNVIHAPPGFVVPKRSIVVATPHTASHADSDRAEGAERLARQDGSALTLGPVAALGDAAVLQLAEGVSIDTIAAGAAGAQHGELSGGAKVHHGGARQGPGYFIKY